jgi:hypothetical protein
MKCLRRQLRTCCIFLSIAATMIGNTRGIDGRQLSDTIDSQSQRQVQDGDFDRFNELFQGASINIPETFEVSERVAFIPLTLYVDNILCYDISVGDIVLDHTVSNTDIDVSVDIKDLNLKCDIDYRYKYGLLHGSGVAQVFTDNNSASTTLRFTSDDYATRPPSTSSMQECTTTINIVSMDFHNDLTSDIVEWFEKWLRQLIEPQIETVACSELASLGTTFVEDMLKIADKALEGYENEILGEDLTDPLYLERSTTLPDDLVAFNLQNETSFFGNLFNQALTAIDELLGRVVPDPDGPNETDLGINIMLRSSLLNENRALIVNVDDLGMDAVIFQGHDMLTESSITINEIRIMGLDTLTRFDPLTPIGKHTLQNLLTWQFLNLEFDLTVDIKPSTLEDAVLQDATSNGISEQITVDFRVQDINVDASIYLVIDEEALGAMELGSLLLMDNLLPCLLSAMHDAKLAGLFVEPQNIKIPTLNGFVSRGLDRVLTGAAEAAFDMYKGALASTIPNIFQTTVRSFVNDKVLRPSLDGMEAECPQMAMKMDGFVDFRDLLLPPEISKGQGGSGTKPYGSMAYSAMELVTSNLLQVDRATGSANINSVVIEPFTVAQSGTKGTIEVNGNLFETGSRISVGGLDADIKLRASDIKIKNLNTVTQPLALLQTVADEPHHLNNTVTMGLEDHPLHFSTRFFFAIAGDDEIEIKNDMEISFDLDTANVMLMAMLKMANSRLLGFPLRDIFNLNCWIATIPAPALDARGIRVEEDDITAALEEIAVSVSRMNVNVSCIECSSPGMLDLVDLLSTQEAQDGATISANSLLQSATQFLHGNFLQVQMDRLLADAARKCPHSLDYDPNATPLEYQALESPDNESDISFLVLLGCVILGLLATVGLLVLCIKCFVRRRHRKFLASLPKEQVASLENQQRREDALESELNANTKSMFSSAEVVPCLVRWGMPVIIAGNIGLFLSGHLSLGATVNIEASIAGETIKVDEFFEFSMAKSTIDIWNAGGKELAILILIFSGIWPYTKQLMTLALWFTPPSWVSISRRGSILLWLDWLAKWSMIDIFVLVISIAAFRVSIQSPDVAFLPEGFYSVDLLVVPLWGLYANMLAQLVSQISSHVVIHYQRKISGHAKDSYKKKYNLHTAASGELSRTLSNISCDNFEGRRVLRKHQYGRPHRGLDEKLVVRNWANYAVVTIAVSLVVLVILGCILPSFSLDILGLIGVAVESGQDFEAATTSHSVFTVVQLLMDEARFLGTAGDYLGLGTLSALLVLTVLVVPILQSLALLRQWFSPLTMKQRSRVSVLAEILQAWQYAEVYLIAIFVASW